MAKAWLVTCCLAMLLGAGGAGALPARAASSPAQAQAEVEALLNQASAALARKDARHLTAMLDDKAVVEVRGMGLNQRTVGRQRARARYGPELVRAPEPSVEFSDVRVRAAGARANLEAALVAYVVPQMPQGMENLGLFQGPVPVPGRLSALLEKQGRHWVFLRMLFVFPGGAR
ncbi:MAG: hypothetical protein V1806_17770 [Pseudomonadota bacterium]